ncbi:hypothetical protein SK3146_06893 [Paenibacillus konkukensis]|uniref:DUF4303 domain-containing protein n=1 Tax=Paenibacillus konkukensis TaxID=2020716 RepID=A0ABY4RZ56_9BACL|nr:hypothetical protein [Paenibacillus konkukensis]UQZ87591.1 hypothetical protein SK3146_06893 [Paenibacillus konkukensis]
MSSYDIHIGRLINGRRGYDGQGRFWVCLPDQQIVETDDIVNYRGRFVSSKEIEDLLYHFCLDCIREFSETENNRDVYTFSIYTDATHGGFIVYMNNLAELHKSVQAAYDKSRSNYPERNRTMEQIYHDYQFSEGDYSFMYDGIPEPLENILNVYYCVSLEQPYNLRIDTPYIFDKSIVDSQLYMIAMEVIRRLQDDFQGLNRTDNFIAYVSSADGDGGDYLTLGSLIRKCVPTDRLYEAMPLLKEKDDALKQRIDSVKEKSIEEQYQYWMSSISGGEFSDFSLFPFWRTGYQAYELLLELGHSILPAVTEQLKTEEDPDIRYVLEALYEDIRSQS